MYNEIGENLIKEIFQPRPENVHKYHFGLLVVIGGNEFYTGSPTFNALAAFKTGVDMVHILAPKRAADIIASFSPNLAAYPLKGDILKEEHLGTILTFTRSAKSLTNGKAAVVIGGGLGRSLETQKLIIEFLKEVQIPVVIDADAIHALAQEKEAIRGKEVVITPHAYEFFVLTGKELESLSLEEKVREVKESAKNLEATILLKGDIDIISNGEEVTINKTGNPVMTVGGTGDVLAGIIGALLARGVDSYRAAQAGAYINGRAGEIGAEELGESFTAEDLLNFIPEVLWKKE
jgi:NAD(P)H-hydrate epimerase